MAAQTFLASIQRNLEKLKRPVRQRIAKLEEELDSLHGLMAGLGGSGENGHRVSNHGVAVVKTRKATLKSKARPATAKSGKRVRRSPEQLKEEATLMVKFIKGKGTAGATAKEVKAHGVNPGQDLKGFAKQYAGVTLRSTGKKSQTRYFTA